MKLTKDIEGVRSGKVYPEVIKKGSECPPELIDAAIALGALPAKEGKAAAEKARADAEAAAEAEAAAKAAAEAASDGDGQP